MIKISEVHISPETWKRTAAEELVHPTPFPELKKPDNTLVTEQFRQGVASTSDRLKAGEHPTDVPCPKCHQERYLSLATLGPYVMAACDCCGFSWMLP